MTPSALNTLFGTPASQASNAKPASNSTAFGDMLTREINGRQNAAPPAQPMQPVQQSPRADNPPPANRTPQQNSANAPKPAERQSERQNVNASQNAQSEAPSEQQQTDAQASSSAVPADGVDKAAKTSKKDKSDSTDATDQSQSAATADAASTVSAASAELLALVASLMPKTTGAAVAVDPAAAAAVASAGSAAVLAGAGGPNAATAKVATLGLATDPATVAADPAAVDPAFEALLAQAAGSTAARGHAKAEAGAGKSTNTTTNVSDALPAARSDTDSAQLRNNAGSAAVLAVKTDEIVLAAAAAQAAAGKSEPAALAGVTGLGGAIPAGLTQAAGGAPPDTLTPHVGTPAWDHALGQKVVWMAAGAEQSASLTLNPPDLGPIQVVINVSNDQANASFTAAQPEVRQALEAAMPRLKEMLGEAGITLGQASVNAGNPNQNGGADQQAGNGTRRGNGVSGATGRDALDADPVTRSTTRIISGGTGLVDTFA